MGSSPRIAWNCHWIPYSPCSDKPMGRYLQVTRPGKHTKNYGKSQFSMGKSTISMAIFNSYVTNYQRVSVRVLWRDEVVDLATRLIFLSGWRRAKKNISWFQISDLTISWLVGGIPTPLKNMSSSVGAIIPNIWEKHVPNHQPDILIYIIYPLQNISQWEGWHPIYEMKK